VEYLTTGSEDAFDHLVAICFKAKGNLFIPPDRYDLLSEEPDDTLFLSTRRWIQEFLLERLAPYQYATAPEIEDAARRDIFRYLGRTCRLAIIDEVRRRTTKKQADLRASGRILSSNYETDYREDEFADFIGQEPEDAMRSPLGKRPSLTELELASVLSENRREFERLLGHKLFTTLKVEICSYLDGGKAATQAVAQRLKVKNRQARAYRARLRRTLGTAVRSGNRAACRLHELLVKNGRARLNEDGRVSPKGPGTDSECRSGGRLLIGWG
jgi:hypothetical protein